MGSVRVCGMRCHFAKRPKCRCWCGGLFHGETGQEAREVFRAEFGDDPKGEKPLLDAWQRGLDAAKKVGVQRALGLEEK